MRKPIDFFIAGAHKGGTTTFADLIAQHPSVWMPRIGEDAFFGREDLYSRGEEVLALRYRGAPLTHVWGSKYVHAMFMPEVMERLYRHNSAMNIFLILRDPVQRAYSSYWFARAHGWETLSFEAAIEVEMHGGRTASSPYVALTELSHLAHGLYARQVIRCRELFSDTVHVLLLDDLREQPELLMRAVFERLGLDQIQMNYSRRSNEAGEPRTRWLVALVKKENALHKKVARAIVPSWLRYRFEENLVQPMMRRNFRRRRYPPMAEDTRRRLEDYYLEPTLELERVLGRKLPWDWLYSGRR